MTKRVLLFLCLLHSAAHAASLSIAVQGAAEEDGAYVVYANETFQVQLTVRDGGDINSKVTIPGLDKLKVLGQSTSQEINTQGGKTTSEKHFLYEVAAHTEGALTLGPAVAQAGKKKVQSNTI